MVLLNGSIFLCRDLQHQPNCNLCNIGNDTFMRFIKVLVFIYQNDKMIFDLCNLNIHAACAA